MTDITPIEQDGAEDENTNWHDLDDCMAAFLARLSPPQRDNNEDPEYKVAVEYYLAMDLVVWDDSRTRLAILLGNKWPIPPEFLVLLSDILLGKAKKSGRPRRFSNLQEINIYREMCELVLHEMHSVHRAIEIMCDRLNESGVTVDTQTIERLWKRCEADERLKKVFGARDQNPS